MRSWVLLVAAIAAGACGGGSANPHDAPPRDAAGMDSDGPIIDSGIDTPSDADGGAFVCDPVHQTGCAVGQKCDLTATGTFGCVPDGNLGDFRLCDPIQPNACAAGFSCRGTFFGDHRCARLCNPGESQCRSDEPCNSAHTTSDGKPYRMCATNQVCNPILDDCSTPGEHCTFAIRGVCVVPGNTADGDSCQTARDCRQGSACLQAGPGVLKCFRLCDPGGGMPACTTGVTCSLFTTVGPQQVGACGLL